MAVFRGLMVCALLWLSTLVAAAAPLQIVLQSGHSDSIGCASFSPDHRLLATGSDDRTVKLWDVPTGRVLATLRGFQSPLRALVWSGDGRFLAATAAYDPAIHLWDVHAARLRALVAVDARKVDAVGIDASGATLASAGSDGRVHVWSLPGGVEKSAFAAPDGRAVSLAVSTDGSKIFALGQAGTLVCGQRGRTTEIRGRAHGAMRLLCLQAGGTRLAVGGEAGVELYDLAGGGPLVLSRHGVTALTFSSESTELAGSGPGGVTVWRLGGATRDLALTGEALALSLSDTLRVCTATDLLSVGPHPSSLPLRADADGASFLAFSDDSLASGAARWDLRSGGLLAPTETIFGEGITTSLDGHVVALVSPFISSITLLDTTTWSPRADLPVEPGGVTCVALSPDGARLACGGADGHIVIWEVALRRRLLELHADEVRALAWSRDGRWLAGGGTAQTVRVWDAASGRLLHQLRHEGEISSLAFHPAGSFLAAAADGPGASTLVRLWKLPSGREQATWRSPGSSARLFGAIWRTVELTMGLHANRRWNPRLAAPLAFSPDGRLLASGGHESPLLWEVPSGRVAATLEGHSDSVFSLSFHPQGRVLATASEDQTTRVWSVDGTLLATLMEFNGGRDWLVTSPQGFFDGTAVGMEKILWRLNGRLLDTAQPEQYINEFFQPGLLHDVVSEGRPITEVLRQHGDPRWTLRLEQRDRRLPTVSLQVPTGLSALATAEVAVSVHQAAADETHQNAAGARDLRLFNNGVLVVRWAGAVADRTLRAQVPLGPGLNVLTAYAFNADNVKSQDASATVTGDAALRHAARVHVLTIGINRYTDPHLELAYAVGDAVDLAAALQQSSPAVSTRTLRDDQATRDGILNALRDLAAQSDVQDSVVIAYSGHGLVSRGHFFLLPQNVGTHFANLQVARFGISDADLETALLPLHARHVAIILDACHSGQAVESEEWRHGPINARGLGQLAWEKGIDILAASQSRQSALEVRRIGDREVGHGLLTYALLEGMRAGPGLSVRQWLRAAARQVPILAAQSRNLAQMPRLFARRENMDEWVLPARETPSQAGSAPGESRRRIAREDVLYRIPIPAGAPQRGPADAPVTILEWADFQCPWSRKVADTLDALQKSFPRQVRLVWLNMPQPYHPRAQAAAEAALAAAEQGKFWQYHRRLFERFNEYDSDRLDQYAAEIGLDVTRFHAALQSGRCRARVQANRTLGELFGATGTPTFFINGRLLLGAATPATFHQRVEAALRAARAADAAHGSSIYEAVTRNGKNQADLDRRP